MREGRLFLFESPGTSHTSFHPVHRLVLVSSKTVEEETASLTCSVASVVEIHGKGPRLVHCLPGGRGAVFIVGVDVMVVHVLPREHG